MVKLTSRDRHTLWLDTLEAELAKTPLPPRGKQGSIENAKRVMVMAEAQKRAGRNFRKLLKQARV